MHWTCLVKMVGIESPYLLGGTMSNSVVDATEIGSNNYIARLFRQITFEMSGFTKERSYGVKSARLSC
ncbi:hypothetical protein ES703_100200 [subsurface metagenome]